MSAALGEIRRLDFVRGDVMLMRVEDSLSAGERK